MFGVAGALPCSALGVLSEKLGDSHQIFVIHGIGGLTGMFLTGVFAQ